MSSDIDHWHLNATVFKDRVEEIHFISDPARNVRRRQYKKTWDVERFLGRGGCGEVRLERNKEDGMARAVKRIATSSITLSNGECEKELKALLEFSKPKLIFATSMNLHVSNDNLEDVFELLCDFAVAFVTILQISSHGKLADYALLRWAEAAVFVDFFGWFKDGCDVFLAMEFVSLGDLEKNVSVNSGKIPEPEARSIAEQILTGLEIMHAESFAHRDLKPQNVLVVNGSPDWWVKLADFGLSKRLTDTTAFYTKGGTQSYMAPEILDLMEISDASDQYTNSVDIWAVGCIVYRLITGRVPFPPGKSLMKYCEDKSLFPYNPLFDSGIKSEGFKFLRRLLSVQPEERPHASQALKHPWIASGEKCTRMKPPSRSMSKSRPGFHHKTNSHDVQNREVEILSDITQPSVSEAGSNTLTHDGLRSFVSSSYLKSGLPSDHTPLKQESWSTIKRKPVVATPSDQTVTGIRNGGENGPNDMAVDRPICTIRDLYAVLKAEFVDFTGTGEMFKDQSADDLLTPRTKEVCGHLKTVKDFFELDVMVRDHITRLEGDRSYHQELGMILQDPSRQDALLLQENSNENELRVYLNDPVLSRLILDIPSLEGAVENWRSSSPEKWRSEDAIEANPVRLVLEFLQSVDLSSALASPESHEVRLEHKNMLTPPIMPTVQPSTQSGPAPSTSTSGTFGARALLDTSTDYYAALKFKKDDTIIVTDTFDEPSLWWRGRLSGGVGGGTGLFLASCVCRIPIPTTATLLRDQVTHVRGIWKFVALEEDELDFNEGDVIRLLEVKYENWCKGELEGRFGILPLNYVEALPPGSPIESASRSALSTIRALETKSEVSPTYLPYRPSTTSPPGTQIQNDMGFLTVEIEDFSRLRPWSTMCQVSHADNIPFYETRYLGHTEPACNDKFRIDIPSRHSETLAFTIYRIPKLVKGQQMAPKLQHPQQQLFGKLELVDIRPCQRFTYTLKADAYGVHTEISIALTFVPVAYLTRPLKLVGGQGPRIPLGRTRYTREIK